MKMKLDWQRDLEIFRQKRQGPYSQHFIFFLTYEMAQ